METTRRWRALVMLPVPFLAFIGVHATVAALGAPAAPPLTLGDARERTIATVLAIGAVLLAGLTWAPSRALRGVAYLPYALALALGFAGGGMLAVLNLSGGVDGGPPGPRWLLAMLLTGSFVCGASLLPLTYLIVTDWRSSQRPSDRRFREPPA